MRLRYLGVAALACSVASLCSAQEDDDSTASPGLIPASGFVLYYNTQAPLSFLAMAPNELRTDMVPIGEVKAQSCQYELAVPLSLAFRPTSISGAQGNGSYRNALERLQRERPELAGIYDVKIDMHITSVLGVFQRLCTEIFARGFKRR